MQATALSKFKDDKGQPLRVYDPGYMNTICCTSKICYIDGDVGVLEYRGIPIE
jgi:citrate synthase